MTNEEVFFQTKKALSDALKKLMSQKAFSKITVSEIIRMCNVNRKTFYYHFEDIQALLKWMFEQEAIEIVKHYDLMVDYTEVISLVFDYAANNAYIVNCAYDSLGRDVLKRFFCQDFRGITETMVRHAEERLNIHVSDDFRSFLCHLYTEGIAGMLIDLFQHPSEFDQIKMTNYFSLIINPTLPAVLTAYVEEQNNHK